LLYPQNFEQKIGFQQIREILESYCLSPLGLYFVKRMGFLDRFDLVQKLLQQSDEYVRLLNAGADFPTQYYFDVTTHLHRASVQNTFLEPQAFYEIKMSLKTVRQSLSFFADPEVENLYPALKALGANVLVERALLAAIDKVIDDNGHVKDDASPELARLKRDLIAQQSVLRKRSRVFCGMPNRKAGHRTMLNQLSAAAGW
jgi:DNA mismatch repair protein MutS2